MSLSVCCVVHAQVTISGQKYSGQKRKSMMGRGSPCVKRRKSAFSSSSSSCMPSLPLWFLPTPGVSIAGNYNQSRIQLYISTIVEEVAEVIFSASARRCSFCCVLVHLDTHIHRPKHVSRLVSTNRFWCTVEPL